jgi:hypothetical protein
MTDAKPTSFERAKNYIEKAEEYYEMAFQEFTQNKWTREQKEEFIKYLLKILDQQSRMDFIDRI